MRTRLQCVFLLYCMVPAKCNGSIMIYERIIKPFFLKHQTVIDEKMDQAGKIASKVMDEAIDEGQSFKHSKKMGKVAEDRLEKKKKSLDWKIRSTKLPFLFLIHHPHGLKSST